MKQFKRFLIAMVVVCAAVFTLVACNEKAKVTFDYNGGSGENYTVETTVDELLAMPEEPVRAGYAFNGWKNGDAFWTFTKDKVAGDMTLKADWTKTYTVTYTLGGAEGAAPAAVTVKMGEKVSLPSAPAVDGQEFMGWKVGETTKAAGEEVEVTEDLTVTALWNKLCDVTYSLGEFEGYAPAAEVVDFGTELTLPAAPAVKGYTFKGWKVGDAVKAAGSKITVETDLAITATYEINTYTVNYYGYYGELLESEKVTYGEAAKYDGTPEGSGNIFVGFLGWSETEALKAVDRDMDVYSLWGYPQSDDKYFTFVESGDGYLVQAADDIADAFDGSVIYLPAEHNGKVVKGIVSFEKNDELQSGAFANLPASTVVIPSSYKTIGDYAFYKNTNIETVLFDGKGLTSIGNYAFYDTENLSDITFPATLETINSYAFAYTGSIANNATGEGDDLSKLTELKVEEGSALKTIGVRAFAYAGFTSLEIPASVEVIDDYAFYVARGLTSVKFAENGKLTTIGEYAFSGNDGASWTGSTAGLLRTVEIPASVKTLELGAFFRQQFESVILHEGLETVGDRAFGASATKYNTVKTLVIPASVKTIGEYAFRCWGGVTDIAFNEGTKLSSIGDYAFYECSSLETIEIPNTVTYIGEKAFYNAYALTGMTFAEGNNEVGLEFAEQAIAYSNRLALNPMKSFEFPARTTKIGQNVFYNRLGLTSIAFEKGGVLDLEIGELAFSQSSSASNSISTTSTLAVTPVTSLEIPARTTKIGKGAFYGMIKLETLTFEEGSKLTEIPTHMVLGCVSLKTLVLPEKLETIGNYAFETNDKAIKYYEYTEEEGAGKTTSKTFDHIGNNVLTAVTLPASLTKIGSYNFKNMLALNTVVFQEGTGDLTIDTLSFAIYNTIKDTEEVKRAELSITFNKNLTEIGAQVFSNTNLKSVTFPEGAKLTTIGQKAFSITATAGVPAPSITTIALPASLKTLDATVFIGYDNLAAFTVVGQGALSAENGALYMTEGADKYLFRLPPAYAQTELTISGVAGVSANAVNNVDGITKITVENVKKLGDGCFADLPSLETVVLRGVEEYGTGIFENDTALTDVTLPDGLTVVPEAMFKGCTALTEFDFSKITEVQNSAFYKTGIAAAVMPNLTALGSSAFNSCTNLTEVDLGKVTELGTNIFQSCTSLTAIDLTDITSIGANVFSGCSKLSDVKWGAFTDIPASAFKGTAITSVNLPNVETVGNSAFADCKSLAAVSLPNATKLDTKAFHNCEVLATVSVPKVAELGTNVFQNNKALKAIDLPSTVTEITGYMFGGCVALESFTVPASVTTIAAYAFNGCKALKTLVLEGDAVKTLDNKNAFTNTPFKTADSGAKIVVKAELLEDYKIAKNWVDYAAYLQAAAAE